MAHRLRYADRTLTLPFAGATDLQFRVARSISMITAFCAAMNNHMSLGDVVSGLTRLLGGSNVAVFRLAHGGSGARIVSAACRSLHRTQPERPSVALARHLVDRHGAKAVAGSVWRLSDLRSDPGFDYTEAARDWRDRNDICEVSLIVLEHTRSHIDLIEIRFETPPQRSPELPTMIIAVALADAWAARESGIVSRMILEQRRAATPQQDTTDAAILGVGNPFNLSRGELRVCQLLGNGLKPVEIAGALGVSISTVRTHLRNIYAKTDASGQVEVMARLHVPQAPEAQFRRAG